MTIAETKTAAAKIDDCNHVLQLRLLYDKIAAFQHGNI